MAGADQTRGPETAEDRWLPRLTGYCWHYRRTFTLALVGAVMATVFTAIIPLLQRTIVDNVIVTHKSSIWPLAIALLAVAVTQFAFTFMRRWAGGRLSLDVQHDLRTDMLKSLARLDGARQDEIHTGQLVSRSISDINMIQSLLSFLPISRPVTSRPSSTRPSAACGWSRASARKSRSWSGWRAPARRCTPSGSGWPG